MSHKRLDPHLLAPKRFVTLAYLNQVEQADYPALQKTTGLSTSELSKIVRDLEECGIVNVSKERKNRYSHTLVRLSEAGIKQFRQLMRTLNDVAGENAESHHQPHRGDRIDPKKSANSGEVG